MKDSPNLDLLRSLAVGLVLVDHLGQNLRWGGAGYSLDALGHVGVAIFFVHTSLVLLLSLERHGESAAPFLVRRFFRIYPLAAVVVMYHALSTLAWRDPLNGWQVLSNLLLVQNITGHLSSPAPLWSLPYEVQMYLLLPALYLVAQRSSTSIAGLWVGCAGAALIAWAAFPSLKLLEYMPCFLPGVLAFAIWHRGGPGRRSHALLWALLVLGRRRSRPWQRAACLRRPCFGFSACCWA